MGCTFFFDEDVNDGAGKVRAVSMLDNHLVPEIRVGPAGSSHDGECIRFDDFDQFERFAEAVDSVYHRLKGQYGRK